MKIKRSMTQKYYSQTESNKTEENSGVKFYKNGSINFIYNGRRPIYNNFRDTLGTELYDAFEKLFENCSSMPITIDVVILSRELKNKPKREEWEQGGVKNYKNGSIHAIYEGGTTKNTLKESLGKELLNALDKSFKYMESKNMPIIMDVIFNVRETQS
jgi:acylphosphatase